MQTYRERFIGETGSWDYGGGDVPQLAVCKWETHSSWGCSSSSNSNAQEPGEPTVLNSSLSLDGPGAGSANVRGQEIWMPQF